MEINTIINVIAIILAFGNFICLYSISKKKAYYEEKGENFATKEDIAGITKEIESVKDSYNKSLERHKIELQKEFEIHKYISNLCQSLDNQLLSHIAKCLKANASKSIIYPDNDNNLLFANIELSRFLNTYKVRYEENELLLNLISASLDLDSKYELQEIHYEMYGKDTYFSIPEKDKESLIELLNRTLTLFLPPFKQDLNEEPEH